MFISSSFQSQVDYTEDERMYVYFCVKISNKKIHSNPSKKKKKNLIFLELEKNHSNPS